MSEPDSQVETPNEADPEISLLDILIAVGEEKLIWLTVTFLAGVLGVTVSLLATPVYEARTVIMPQQQGGAGAGTSTLASLGALAGMVGLGGLNLATKSSDELYIAFMHSRSVLDGLIEKLELTKRYQSRTMEEARQSLSSSVSAIVDKKSGLITVVAQDSDPQFAAQLANAQVAELNILLSRLAITEAQQRRLYYEQQIDKALQLLAAVEVRFRDAQQKSGLKFTGMIADVGIRSSLGIRSQIATLEIQMQARGRFATPQNPDMQQLSSELSALRAQLAKYEEGSGHSSSAAPFQQEAMQAYRDLKVQEAKLDAFVRQLEIARIDEAKEGPTLQVLDVALPPEQRSKPERRKTVMSHLAVGILLGMVLALLKAFLCRATQSARGRQSLTALKRSWSFKPRS